MTHHADDGRAGCEDPAAVDTDPRPDRRDRCARKSDVIDIAVACVGATGAPVRRAYRLVA
jgi:hypothetical protein